MKKQRRRRQYRHARPYVPYACTVRMQGVACRVDRPVQTGAMANQQAEPLAVVLRGLDHDLRTPVANILGFADLIRAAEGGALTADQALFLQRIEENCQAMMAQLERLTETAKRLLPAAQRQT